MYELTKNEELILLIVFRLKGNAYGVTIRSLFKEITKRDINFGSMYNTLYLLVRRGFIVSEQSEPSAKKGGKRKKMYTLTKSGMAALHAAQEVQKLAWKDIPDMAITEK
ncbi:MAG: PadR family transcriptional regulator [bacterium]|nr:PadR family transcriptional regulator [bacterium]